MLGIVDHFRKKKTEGTADTSRNVKNISHFQFHVVSLFYSEYSHRLINAVLLIRLLLD